MKEIFNKYAVLTKALAEDFRTSLPRCYRHIFENELGKPEEGADKIDKALAHLWSGVATTGISAVGMAGGMLAGTLPLIVAGATSSYLLFPAMAIGIGVGVPVSLCLGMKAHAGITNGFNRLSKGLFNESYEKIPAEAFPAYNRARHALKP